MAVKMLMANFKGTDNVIGTYFRTFHHHSKMTEGFLVKSVPNSVPASTNQYLWSYESWLWRQCTQVISHVKNGGPRSALVLMTHKS